MRLLTFAQMAEPPFRWRMLLQQLLDDLLSKETETGFTYTYAWMADQVGHFSIGVLTSIPVLWISDQLVSHYGPVALGDWLWLLPILGVIVAFIKEAMDYVRSRRDAERSAFHMEFARGDVLRNAVTAFFYLAAGFLVAAFSWRGFWWGTVASFSVFVVGGIVATYWLKRRLFFQQSGTSYVRRVWSFQGGFQDRNKSVEDVRAFIHRRHGHLHLALVGDRSTGKTTLATAIATEVTARFAYLRYLNFFSLLELAGQGNEPSIQLGSVVWQWRRCQVLVIDDIAAELPNGANYPEIAGLFQQLGRDNLEDLRSKQTLWIVGADVAKAVPYIEAIGKVALGLDGPVPHLVLKDRLDPDLTPKVRGKQR